MILARHCEKQEVALQRDIFITKAYHVTLGFNDRRLFREKVEPIEYKNSYSLNPLWYSNFDSMNNNKKITVLYQAGLEKSFFDVLSKKNWRQPFYLEAFLAKKLDVPQHMPIKEKVHLITSQIVESGEIKSNQDGDNYVDCSKPLDNFTKEFFNHVVALQKRQISDLKQKAVFMEKEEKQFCALKKWFYVGVAVECFCVLGLATELVRS